MTKPHPEEPEGKQNKTKQDDGDTAAGTARAKAFGQLVALGFDVTVFTPAPYQRRSLRRPSKELSSCGRLRA